MGTLLLSRVRDEYPDAMLCTYSVVPSPRVSATVVEPYNAMLSFHELLENANIVMCLDNEALYNICTGTLGIKSPSYGDLNYLISLVMSGITSSLRFPGQLNSDLRKLAVNLTPFPFLHFFMASFAPLVASTEKEFRAYNVQELVTQAFDPRNIMAAAENLMQGEFLTAALMFRGKISNKDVDDQMAFIRLKFKDNFVDWIPGGVSASICDVPPRKLKASCTFVANSTAVYELFYRVWQQFTKMYRRKAFIHQYLAEGMDENEFVEAENNLRELVHEYLQHSPRLSSVLPTLGLGATGGGSAGAATASSSSTTTAGTGTAASTAGATATAAAGGDDGEAEEEGKDLTEEEPAK